MKKQQKENNLHLLRLLHDDLAQKNVAFKMGVSQAAYSKMEKGELIPSKEAIKKLSDLYNCNVAEFLYLEKTELRTRLLGKSTETEINLKDQMDMKLNTTKRKFKLFINRIKK